MSAPEWTVPIGPGNQDLSLAGNPLLELAFERAPLGMWVAAVERPGDVRACRVLRTNPAMAAMLGYSAGELTGPLDLCGRTHPDDLAVDSANLKLLLIHREPAWQWEKRFLRRDGGVVWARVFVSVVPAPPSAPEVLIGQAEDITARRAAAPDEVADESEVGHLRTLCGQLQQALDTRVVIEQAKGVISATERVSMDGAFERLRAHARRHSVSIQEVAAAVVNLGLRP